MTIISAGSAPCLPQLCTPPLIRGNRYLKLCVPLHRAALKGDWKAAEVLIQKDPNLLRTIITEDKETALHIAAAAEHVFFVEKLMDRMTEKDLEIQNEMGNTALFFAATTGNVQIAILMTKKNDRLQSIRGPMAKTPLYIAALLGHGDMAFYLYMHPSSDFKSWTSEDKIQLLNTCIISGLCGVALKIVKDCPELALARDEYKETPLHVLARKPSAFVDESQLGRWSRIINSFSRMTHNEKRRQDKGLELLKCILEHVWDNALEQEDLKISDIAKNILPLLFVAAKLGNEKFLVELLRSYPDFVRQVNDKKQSIFHIAVSYRYEHIFNLIYEIGTLKDLIATYRDEDDNNMLHLAAKFSPNQRNVVSGAALQMHRELLWYKAVEKIVGPWYTEMKNKKGETPQHLFTKEHECLMKDGEKWMNTTANSCMVVAALIATVVFTAAFTVPGGYDEKDKKPTLLNERFFTIFSISVVVAMLSSSTSILMFLSILASRYVEKDFLRTLPFCLLIGVATLFVSITAMMVAFCTTFVLYYHNHLGLPLVFILFGAFTSVPIMFILLKCSLLVDTFRSAFGSTFLFYSRKRLFC